MQVFISHARADSPLAARVSKALEKTGLRVWNEDVNLLPGDNWAAHVARALDESEAMVLLLTPDWLSSPYVRREMEYALGSKNYSNRLIPVVVGGREQLANPEIPWILRQLPWVELENPESGDRELQPIADAIRSHA